MPEMVVIVWTTAVARVMSPLVGLGGLATYIVGLLDGNDRGSEVGRPEGRQIGCLEGCEDGRLLGNRDGRLEGCVVGNRDG